MASLHGYGDNILGFESMLVCVLPSSLVCVSFHGIRARCSHLGFCE